MELSDLASTLDEAIEAWLQRHASESGPARPDLTATATLPLAIRVVGEVTSVCENWHLTVRLAPCSRAGWCLMQVSGPGLPVLAFADVVNALRAFGAH